MVISAVYMERRSCCCVVIKPRTRPSAVSLVYACLVDIVESRACWWPFVLFSIVKLNLEFVLTYWGRIFLLAGKAKHGRPGRYIVAFAQQTISSYDPCLFQCQVWFTCPFTLNIGDCSFERGLCNWKNWKSEEEDQFDWMIGKAVAKSQSKTTPQYTSNLTNGENPNDELLLISVQTDWLANLPPGWLANRLTV